MTGGGQQGTVRARFAAIAAIAVIAVIEVIGVIDEGTVMGKLGRSLVGGTLGLAAIVGVGLTGGAAFSKSAPTIVSSPNETVSIVMTNSNTGPIILRGFVTDSGTDTVVSPTEDKATLSQGTLYIDHWSHDHGGTFIPNYSTCAAKLIDFGSFEADGGTGAYSDLFGEGSYSLKGTFLFKRGAHGCEFDSRPITSTVVVTATGHLFFD